MFLLKAVLLSIILFITALPILVLAFTVIAMNVVRMEVTNEYIGPPQKRSPVTPELPAELAEDPEAGNTGC